MPLTCKKKEFVMISKSMSLAAAVATVHSNPSAMLNHCRHSFLGVDEKTEYREDRKKVDKKGHYPQYISVDVFFIKLECFKMSSSRPFLHNHNKLCRIL